MDLFLVLASKSLDPPHDGSKSFEAEKAGPHLKEKAAGVGLGYVLRGRLDLYQLMMAYQCQQRGDCACDLPTCASIALLLPLLLLLQGISMFLGSKEVSARHGGCRPGAARLPANAGCSMAADLVSREWRRKELTMREPELQTLSMSRA